MLSYMGRIRLKLSGIQMILWHISNDVKNECYRHKPETALLHMKSQNHDAAGFFMGNNTGVCFLGIAKYKI